MLSSFNHEPMTRFELVTSSLPRKRSTPELHRHSKVSGRRGSNSRRSAWKADALPTELLPLNLFCGESRIRTCEGVHQQIYSLSSLAAWVFPLQTEPMEGFEPPTSWLQISCSGQLSYIGDCWSNKTKNVLQISDCKCTKVFLIAKVFIDFFIFLKIGSPDWL